ncbi:MAG: WbuC family cupin fold metalloprotein [Alistipes sp.]|nr:WbuC family cupin fold metalloprotein [Alistipes sp.]
MTNRPKIEFIDRELMDDVARQARLSPRQRMNYNFHRSVDEAVNRLLNVMHRGSYLPVHRHLNPDRSESIVVVRGRVGVTIYDDAGAEVECRMVGEGCDCVGFDIEAGVWHGLVVLRDDTVLFEVKQGPYAPIMAENLAPWTPAVDDAVAVERFVAELESKFEVNNKLKQYE